MPLIFKSMAASICVYIFLKLEQTVNSVLGRPIYYYSDFIHISVVNLCQVGLQPQYRE